MVLLNYFKKLKPYKDSGPDEIPAYLLKETSKKIAPALILIAISSIVTTELYTF